MEFLSRHELVELTGASKRPVQIRWLAERGYRFEIGADGNPKVLSSAVQSRLEEKAPRRRRRQPDWSAVR
ncbi:MAG: DUF4224 domain-containing protein [Gammaproteobacteria bacterium]|nr:DUF4224 domain-containing protein [Gammaproteobacteria bacterium]